jgi:hypothetical protein
LRRFGLLSGRHHFHQTILKYEIMFSMYEIMFSSQSGGFVKMKGTAFPRG